MSSANTLQHRPTTQSFRNSLTKDTEQNTLLEIIQYYKTKCTRLKEDNSQLKHQLQVHHQILQEQAALKAQLRQLETELQPSHASLQKEIEALKKQTRTAHAKLVQKDVLVRDLRRQVEELQSSLRTQDSCPRRPQHCYRPTVTKFNARLSDQGSDLSEDHCVLQRGSDHYETKLKILTVKIKEDQALIQRLQEELEQTYSIKQH